MVKKETQINNSVPGKKDRAFSLALLSKRSICGLRADFFFK
jgi:hypothetical protein